MLALESAIERTAVDGRHRLRVSEWKLTAAKRQVDGTVTDQQPADHDSGRLDRYAAADDSLPIGVVQELAVADLCKRRQQPQGVSAGICREIATHRPRAALPGGFDSWFHAGVDVGARAIRALPAKLRALEALAARFRAPFVDVKSQAGRL